MAVSLRPTDIANMLADMLAGAVGGNRKHWLHLVGPIEALPIVTNIQSNWRVSPIAMGDELAAITKAVELLRAEEPYVVP